MSYAVVQAPTFWDSVRSMGDDDPYRSDLLETMAQLHVKPFDNPKLATHKVGKAKNGKDVLSSDVKGRKHDRRLVWQVFNNTIVFLLYGTHAVQDRAKRMRIDFDPSDQLVTIYEQVPSDESQDRPYLEQRQEIGKAFMAWTDDELAGHGFAEPVIAVLRRLDDQNELLELEADMKADEFERAFNLLAYAHPDGEDAAQAVVAGETTEPLDEQPEVTEHDLEVEQRLRDVGRSEGFTQLDAEELERILAAPIEDWMLFLHPDQQSAVTKRYNGPARVRGSAGTGKTVVMLHRAAELAHRYHPEEADPGDEGRLLVTTYIRSLPPVLEHLFARLPGAKPDRVDFTNVDKLASRVCREAGVAPTIDPRAVEAAQSTAWKQTNTPDSPLRRAGITEAYAAEEVTTVIKGRGLGDFDSYLHTKRTGRKLQLSDPAKQQIWEFAQRWNEGLRERGVSDFADIVLRARDLARQRREPTYRAALIDEAQDLTLAGLQLVRALVNGSGPDRPDGLFLAGDGAQRIYPGGFTLRQAGVEVRGRTTVLRINYRNSAEVLDVAMATTGEESVEDLDEQFTRAGDAGETTRHSARPQLFVAANDFEQGQVVADQIELLVEDRSNGIGSGDIAVLCPSNKSAKELRGALQARHLPAIDLNDYEGIPTSSVKVGTYHRVKGLEFKAVILPDLSDGVFPRSRPAHVTEEQWADQEAAMMASLFVAMTRARDRLILTCVRTPSPALEGAIDQLELVETDRSLSR